ncbi:MAG: hypothetical protein OXU20_30205 [Myxococcales bacterium]|nr:hypothetical protein [Myxococcales bacterium]MDD9970243.1 hypothetical protein [Myxococcales bacterium]
MRYRFVIARILHPLRGLALALVLQALLASLVVGPYLPRSALAQTSDVQLAAAARDFFAQGLRFADKSQWDQAADRFRRALTIRYSPVIAFNLASSLDELGELVEASELLYRVEADEEAEATLRQSATQLLDKLRPRMSLLTVRLGPHVSKGVVTLDGSALPDVQIGAPFPVDPGDHELVLVQGSRTLAREQVKLKAGAKVEVSLKPARAPTPSELAALEMANRDRVRKHREAPITERWWLWAGMGTALASVVAIVTVAALSGASQRAPLPSEN